MKKWIAIALAAIAAGVGTYLYMAKQNAKTSPYRTASVERGEITYAITATGNINAVTTVQVGSQTSGTILKIMVDYNSRVGKGQVIAQIDPRLFEASLVQARANLDNARAVLEKARVLTADTARTLARNKELVGDGFVSQADVDAAQTAYDSAVFQQKSAEAQLEQAKGAASVAETNLAYTTIRSPVNGIVISRNVDVGQTVAASFQTPTLFTIAQDLTKMQIDTNVDEADIANVRVGQETSFTVDAYPEKTFRGEVTQIRNSPIVTQNVVTYDVVIQVDNRDLLLKPGMTANVSVQIKKVKDALKIPNTALRYKPGSRKPAEDRKQPLGQQVYAIGKDGKPRGIPVRLGISDGTFTELAQGDLKEGIQLIVGEIQKKTNGASGAPPGMGGFR